MTVTWRRAWPRILRIGLFCQLGLFAALAVPAQEPPAGATELRFTPLNGSYSQPDPQLAPVERGALRITLRSPENELLLDEHRLWLTRRPDGSHDAVIEAEFSGSGKLEATLDLGGMERELADEVRLPTQTVRVEGRVTIEPREGSYLVTALELQERVWVKIDSQVAGSLVDLCRGLSRLSPVDLGCGGLGQALSRASVPLPGPGETFLLRRNMMTDAEKVAFDAYLGAP